METHVLAFVVDPDEHQVYIHLDEGGAQILILELQRIIDSLKKGEVEHFHLFSNEWSGHGDLSITTMFDRKNTQGSPVHHVKCYGWTDEWVDRHGLERQLG